jgi:hypothetical protein
MIPVIYTKSKTIQTYMVEVLLLDNINQHSKYDIKLFAFLIKKKQH